MMMPRKSTNSPIGLSCHEISSLTNEIAEKHGTNLSPLQNGEALFYA